MIWDYVSALSGIVGTLIAMSVSCYAFITFRNAAVRCRERERRLPDATRFEDLRRQIVDHENRLEEVQDELLAAREAIGEGQVVRGEYNKIVEQTEKSRADLENLREVYTQRKQAEEKEYTKLAAELQKELNSLDHKLEQEEEKIQRSLSTVKVAAEDEKENIERSLATYKVSVENEINDLKRELTNQKKRVAEERDSELLKTQREYDQKLLQITSSYEQQKASWTAKLVDVKAEVDTIKSTIDRLTPVKEELTSEVDALQEMHSKIKVDVDGLRSEKAQLEKTIPKLEELWKRLLDQTGGGDDVDRTAELWQPVFAASELENNFDEREGLGDVQKYLKSCGLRYSDRTVYAFHTSLKVTDTSPLVVLAGISGTGKSELPRRYAEALGINFLNLAVQPRWDSPQDMFGFFNYLENRFRATELGRALVQMDPYWHESDRGWPAEPSNTYVNLADQMLLVLLDEMNLARVEYYFSEFLSRLEIRRGVREGIGHDRRKAELPLEIGRTGLGSPTMNVFVAKNVLFVGTMNEDETTQTLSDKVMDRSNLMRFGRPRSLELTDQVGEVKPANYRLAFKTWTDWQTSGEDMTADREQLETWIEKLNHAMSLVKRPFAHRTGQAIRAYVANYPQIEPQWFQHALADQIEQKLLPKFQGLDPAEPGVGESLDQIRDIIDELEDVELREAVQASRDSHQFSWSGVDRDALLEQQL